MPTTYRAAYYKNWVLTSPDQAHLSDAELIEEAVKAAYAGDVVCKSTDDPDEPRLTEQALREGLRIGEWTSK